MFIPSDLRTFGLLALAMLALLLVVWVVLKKLGLDPLGLLNRQEWLIASKIVGILLLGFVLYQSAIVFDFPAEKFIYGRF